MPILPPSQCAAFRCKAPAVKGSAYCADHAPKKRAANDRRAMDSAYRSATWATIRATVLSANPLCLPCKQRGQIVPASIVDHVFPWKRYGRQAFTLNLFNGLCPNCHSVKTAQENRGVFMHYGEHENRTYSPDDWPGAVWLALKTGAAPRSPADPADI